MPKKSKTAYFTSRGAYFGNMWAVYSIKADRVLLLGSDRQLAHWLLKLEFSHDIKSFVFEPGYKEIPNGSDSYRLDYHVEVFPTVGSPEIHYLRTAGKSIDYDEKRDKASNIKYRYCEFNDENWTPDKSKIMPLLKVSSYLNSGRNAYIPQGLIDSASDYLHLARRGNLRSYLSALNSYDKNLSLLIFCRFYAEGIIEVNFEQSLFDLNTWWWIYGH